MATAASTIPAARQSARTKVLMRGAVYGPEGAMVAWIRDISNDGALVTIDGSLAAGSDVIFKRGPIFAAAQVAWSRGGSAGLNFYRQLGDSELTSAQFPLPNRDD